MPTPTEDGARAALAHLTTRTWFVGLYVDRAGTEASTPGYARRMLDASSWTDPARQDRSVVATAEARLPMIVGDQGERAAGFFVAAEPSGPGAWFVPVPGFDLADGVIPEVTITLAVPIGG